MKIIIPMAGMGKRMRPHTLTIPKPLIPIAGKPMVQRIVEDLAQICHEKFTDVGYVISRAFGKEAEQNLIKVAEKLGAKGHIFYQDEPLGTAHAILCAEKILDGKVLIAFSDTLFIPDLKAKVDTEKDGIIWVQKIEDPRQFGVVKLDKEGYITDFVEKPQTFISDLAIIGIYYFKEGAYLKKEMQYLIDNNIKEKGEFQLTNAMENMKKKGTKFVTSQVAEWLDCGNKDATVYTNKRILETYYSNGKSSNPNDANVKNSKIIPPCVIGNNVQIINSTVGPFASIGDNTVIENSIVENVIVQANTKIKNAKLSNSMLGSFVEFSGNSNDASVGDYSIIKS
ncbi:MAG: NTP transferase domain-containing protein [Bacteroidetes bacterium]|nr:NTP transferase domain-containing protein [Bacteroidota bacterium]